MERITYGGEASSKYYANSSLALGRQFGRGGPASAGVGARQLAPTGGAGAGAGAEFCLLDLNPHRHELALEPQDVLASSMVPRLGASDLHCDAPAAPAPQQQQQQQQQQPGARSDAAAGSALAAAAPPAIRFVMGSSSEDEEQPWPGGAQQGAAEAASSEQPAGSSGGEGQDMELSSGPELLLGIDDDGGGGGGEQAGEESSEDFIALLPSATGAPPAGDEAQPASAEAEGRAFGFRPPWLPRLARFGSPLLRLHNEVVAFTKMLEPTAEEVESRAKSMQVIREVVASIWPDAEVLVFGSYETGLYTPASDTDVVVVDSGLNHPATGLKALAHALSQRSLVRNMQQILTARVPIIKFEMVDTGLAFDVSWEVRSGPDGAAVVKQLLARWPVLKPLVLVLKVFLTQRELNEVYSGGIGSYSLIVMTAAFLQLHASRRPDPAAAGGSGAGGGGRKRGRSSGGSGSQGVACQVEANLGLLLVDFFRLYGRALNLSEVGVSASGGGCFYAKRERGFFAPDRPWLLSVQDPIDGSNDTARNSWNIKVVRQVFDHAYQLLTAPCGSGESLLGRIIHLSPVVAGRPVPAWFNEAPSSAARKHGSRHSSAGKRGSERDARGQQQAERSSGRGGSDRQRSRSRGRDGGGSGGHGSRRKSKSSRRGGSRERSRDRQPQQGAGQRWHEGSGGRKRQKLGGGRSPARPQHSGGGKSPGGSGGGRQQQQQQPSRQQRQRERDSRGGSSGRDSRASSKSGGSKRQRK